MKPKLTLTLWYGLLLTTTTCSFTTVQAQKPHFGLKLGMISSNLSFRAADPIRTTTPKLSVTFGAFLNIPVSNRFTIRPSVEYVSKGGHASLYFQRKVQFSYIDIPLNLIYGLPHKKNKLLAGCGPVISFLLNDKEWSEYNTNDIGVNIMTGYEWAIGVSLNLNFTQGLKNIAPNKAYGEDIKNHYSGFTIGYWF